MFPAADTFSLDFHPIPYRGDPTGLDRHYLPCRGAAGPSVQTFFALEQESRCLCYANANLTRADQPGELMRFVEFWHALTGHDPQWLYFDSKLVDYPELSRVNHAASTSSPSDVAGPAILRRLDALPRSAWTGAVLDTPHGAINRSATSTKPSNCAAMRGRSARSPWTAWAARSRRCSCRITSRRRLGM